MKCAATIGLSGALIALNIGYFTPAMGAELLARDSFNLSAVTATGGTVVALPDVGTPVWLRTLDERHSALENMIATPVANSSLTEQQVHELRRNLRHISSALETARCAGPITYQSALPIAMSMDVVGTRIHNYLPNIAYRPLVYGGRIALVDGLYSPVDELSLRRAALGSAVDTERLLGRITPNEAHRLQYQLGAIGVREGRFRRDGLLTCRELGIIDYQLDYFAHRLANMAGRQIGLACAARPAMGCITQPSTFSAVVQPVGQTILPLSPQGVEAPL